MLGLDQIEVGSGGPIQYTNVDTIGFDYFGHSAFNQTPGDLLNFWPGTIELDGNPGYNGDLETPFGTAEIDGQVALGHFWVEDFGQLAGSGTIDLTTPGYNIGEPGGLYYSSQEASTFDGSITGSGGVEVSYGSLALTGVNSYSGGTVVSDGTLIVANAKALPDGTSLTIGAGGTFLFDPSQSAPSALAVGLAASVPDVAAACETPTPIIAASACDRLPATSPTISTLSPTISAPSGSPAKTPPDFTATVTTTRYDAVRQVSAGAAPLSTHCGTDAAARTASASIAKDVPPVAMPAATSRVTIDAVFASHRSAFEQTVSLADIRNPPPVGMARGN